MPLMCVCVCVARTQLTNDSHNSVLLMGGQTLPPASTLPPSPPPSKPPSLNGHPPPHTHTHSCSSCTNKLMDTRDGLHYTHCTRTHTHTHTTHTPTHTHSTLTHINTTHTPHTPTPSTHTHTHSSFHHLPPSLHLHTLHPPLTLPPPPTTQPQVSSSTQKSRCPTPTGRLLAPTKRLCAAHVGVCVCLWGRYKQTAKRTHTQTACVCAKQQQVCVFEAKPAVTHALSPVCVCTSGRASSSTSAVTPCKAMTPDVEFLVNDTLSHLRPRMVKPRQLCRSVRSGECA